MVDFVLTYWGIIPLLASLIVVVKWFASKPTEKRLELVRQWLIWAVAQAELEYGFGLGEIKLARVYDMFVSRFPRLARVITLERFKSLVDETLVSLKDQCVATGVVGGKSKLYQHPGSERFIRFNTFRDE